MRCYLVPGDTVTAGPTANLYLVVAVSLNGQTATLLGDGHFFDYEDAMMLVIVTEADSVSKRRAEAALKFLGTVWA